MALFTRQVIICIYKNGHTASIAIPNPHPTLKFMILSWPFQPHELPPPMLRRCQRATRGPVEDPATILAVWYGPIKHGWKIGKIPWEMLEMLEMLGHWGWAIDTQSMEIISWEMLEMSIDVHWCPFMSIDVHWYPLMSMFDCQRCKWNRWSWTSKSRTHCGPPLTA